MKRKPTDKLDLTVNPITGYPTEAKRYYYAKTETQEVDEGEEDEPKRNLEIDDAKVTMLLERLRWRGARKIRGYKFKGTIPEPKTAADYLPWLKEE